MGYVISELCYKGTFLQRNYRKTTILWSFFYNFFVKFHIKKELGATSLLCNIQICLVIGCVIMGL